ncbi:MAG: alanine:cation symporter family protein [Clostridia bacterium]|nr:alanine:cation symporter family protein [Clostridia bacterium]
MTFLETIIGKANDMLYGYVLIIVLLAGGLYFTVRTGGVQFRLFGEQIRSVAEKPKDGEGVSSFKALMVSTASRVGTGNIIGVSTALCLGGFGAMFWMWVVAALGAATAMVESTLAQIYKRRGENGSFGGPAYYIEKGLGCKWLAVIFSVVLIVTYGFGFNMLASFNLQSTFSAYGFYNADVTPWIIGAVLAVLVGVCLFGGGKWILNATGVLVPAMGVAYILVALIVMALNITSLPSVFAEIFKNAFDFRAIFGGFSGSCVMYGIKRGLFSNEAGVGSAPNASAAADVSHPVKQGLVQTLSVFIDTIVICSATGFMCMSSGVEATAAVSGAAYVQQSLAATLGGFGPVFITVAMVLFAFTTLLGNLYYVDQCVFYIVGFEPPKWVQHCYHAVGALVVLLGAGLSADFLWNFSDMTMGVMTLINIPVIVILGKYAYRAIKNYTVQRKEGKDPTFRASDIDLPHDVDYWQ